MYVEFACYDEYSEKEIERQIFKALELGVNGISVQPSFLPLFCDFVPPGIVFSTPIDHPYGLAETKIRNHAIIRAIQNKANAIDLVANFGLLINNRANEFVLDLSSAKKICDQDGVSLRVILDYRILSTELINTACACINTLGIEYVFTSTGMWVDDYEDNIIVCHDIQSKHHLLAICNGNLYSNEHIKLVKLAGLFGVRFDKIIALKNCIIGV